MTERPTLFSGPMVRAIRDGRKTQTRRLDGLHEINKTPGQWTFQGFGDGGTLLFTHRVSGELHTIPTRYVVGEDRWVRETWGSLDADHPLCKDGRKPRDGDRLVYRANPADDYQWGSGKHSQGDFCWRPSIHMPRWACRLVLEVKTVRVERLQEISDVDAIAEGIQYRHELDPYGSCHYQSQVEPNKGFNSPAAAFHELWDSLNEKRGYGWNTNPWAWAIEFKQTPVNNA